MDRKLCSVIWLIACVFACTNFAYADTGPNLKKLKIGVSFSIPPWVIKESSSGIELDLLHLAFEDTPYAAQPVFAPFGFVHKLFDSGDLDGYVNAKPNPSKRGYISDTVVTFQNVAISLSSKEYPKDITMEFLRDKQVVAFQKASQLLGPSFKMMSESNPDYQEIAKQSLQINLLFVRNADFIVLDKSIFGYYWHLAAEDPNFAKLGYNYHKPVTFHPIFPPSDYAFRFKDKEVRDTFNEGLKKIRENGKYQDVMKRYDHLSSLYE